MSQSFTKDQLKAIYNYRVVKARDDFLQYRILINPKLKFNWYVIDLTYKLQQFALELEAGLKPMLLIQAPPQHGKSEGITDIISWIAGRNPHLKTIFASFSERLGVRANLKLQRLYTRKIYQDIFPNTQINSKNVVTGTNYLRNREILEYCDKGGYFRNTTVQGSITGESLDLGIIDDPLKGREEANSQTIRDKTWEWFTDDFFTRFSENAGFLMILTRWHIDDPAGRLIERNKKIKVVTYKAIAEEDEEHRKKGQALFPEHKSLEFLNERKLLMGDNFLALYQQSPIIKGGNTFKTSWIKYVSREVINTIIFDKYFITVDTALKNNEKNDYTVYSAFGVFENRLYYLDMYRGKPLSKEREVTARDFYNRNNKYPFQGMYIEQKASGIDLFQRMRDDSFMVFEIERNTDKIFRANNNVSYLEIYGLYVVDDLPNVTDFISEYEQFPNSKNDDIIDTLIDGVEIAYKNQLIDYGAING
ncbi:phage terminase large subunit [Arcobacter lanthieri]|uniref:phage terminase large subunit n=1 Tax=Aliarcobacter lanthieri TaxID=1355374 RepID=UPI001922D75E|nr:phage terminase large subunit [Aliarcobacter lanthieri]MBL3520293.1 phage terminase large subunit [Aliarcobacter lanthieri]